TGFPDVSLRCIPPIGTSRNKKGRIAKSRVQIPPRIGLGFPSCSGREWQFDSERCAPADLRSKVYRTIEKLHNPKRARESDSATPRTRGEKQLKYFLPVFQWDTFAGIAHANFRHFTAAAEDERQLSAVGDGFRGVQQQIQHRLLEQSGIHVNPWQIDRQQVIELVVGFLQLPPSVL